VIFDIEAFGMLQQFDSVNSSQILSQFKHAYETGFKTSTEHTEAMTAYIVEHTPPDTDALIFECWCDEVRSHIGMSTPKVSMDGVRSPIEWVGQERWVKFTAIKSVFDELQRTYKVSQRHIIQLLKRHGCHKQLGGGSYYKLPDSSVHVVKDLVK
jgi:hypothetical protein